MRRTSASFAIGSLLIPTVLPAWAQNGHFHPAPPVVEAQARTPAPRTPAAAPQPARPADMPAPTSAPAAAQPAAVPSTPTQAGSVAPSVHNAHTPTVFTLRSGIADGRMVFIGVGGAINGKVNPPLQVHEGELVQVNLINGEGAEHDVIIDQFPARSERVVAKGASSTFSFTADRVGEFAYYCSVAGHREAGMEGRVQIVPGARAASADAMPDITRDPTDLPPPIGARGGQTVRVDFETVEMKGRLADGASYSFWTFNRKVPGPFVRARVGDTIEVHVKNSPDSVMIHSVDFHGATGPGGVADFTQTEPGDEKVATFKALAPGLFVYHCATPSVAHHITSGMYGLLLVEPEGGLPRVDREFYVMQGELYTAQPFGTNGEQEMDYDKLISERAEYFVFNGAVGALTKNHPLRARPGETVRIFFGVGGPNYTSSFHVIGEIFDRVYPFAGLTSPPLTNVQTVTVPPGGATAVEFKIDRPGRYVLVDHALSRVERGLAGFLVVDGPHDDDIMHAGVAAR